MTKEINTLDQLLKSVHSALANTNSAFEKFDLSSMLSNSLVHPTFSQFPKIDIYGEYDDNEDSEKKKLKLVHYKVFLAGYRKEDLEIKTDSNYLFLEGQVKEDNPHFRETDTIKRHSNNVSAKKFKLKIPIRNFKLDKATMEDGVLTISLVSTFEQNLQKVDIN